MKVSPHDVSIASWGFNNRALSPFLLSTKTQSNMRGADAYHEALRIAVFNGGEVETTKGLKLLEEKRIDNSIRFLNIATSVVSSFLDNSNGVFRLNGKQVENITTKEVFDSIPLTQQFKPLDNSFQVMNIAKLEKATKKRFPDLAPLTSIMAIEPTSISLSKFSSDKFSNFYPQNEGESPLLDVDNFSKGILLGRRIANILVSKLKTTSNESGIPIQSSYITPGRAVLAACYGAATEI
jgi:hypothetical protein